MMIFPFIKFNITDHKLDYFPDLDLLTNIAYLFLFPVASKSDDVLRKAELFIEIVEV